MNFIWVNHIFFVLHWCEVLFQRYVSKTANEYLDCNPATSWIKNSFIWRPEKSWTLINVLHLWNDSKCISVAEIAVEGDWVTFETIKMLKSLTSGDWKVWLGWLVYVGIYLWVWVTIESNTGKGMRGIDSDLVTKIK